MRYILLLFFVFYSYFVALSQIWYDQLLIQNTSPTLSEKITNFNSYRSIFPYKKGNGYKPYARELDFVEKRVSNDKPFPSRALYNEWLITKARKVNSNANWASLGPVDVPIILSNGKNRGVGRINAIAFHPTNADILYVGSPSGGFWKSTDGGLNWLTSTDNLPVIGVSHIAVDPLNPQIIYIATGDANGSDTYSIGVLKSIDGGQNWDTTGLSYNVIQAKKVNKIVINPNFPDSVFAVTNTNIMLSTNGGINWNNIGPLGRWRDIEFKPGDPSVIYAAKQSSGGSNVYRSNDGGSNWAIINNGVASTGKYRPLIAVTNANPEVIYALYSSADYGLHGIYKSSDGGNNWVLQANSPNILGRATDGTGVGGQAWYDLSLGVSTINENHLYVGGINLWESTDGGINWNIEASSGNSSNYSYMHVDQHCLEFNPINNTAYAGNDGGIYKFMTSLNKFVDISDGLAISQFYKLGLSTSNSNRIIAGAQDNGTEMTTNGIWDAVRGSDGMECIIDPYNEDLLYSSSQYGGIRKCYDISAPNYTWDNIKPVNYEGAWVTPYKMHANNNAMIVAGYDEVYKTTTAGAIWDSISYGVSNGQALRTIALAPSNEDYIYAASYLTLKVTKDGGGTWVNIKPGLPNLNISDITVSNVDPEKLWVTFSEYSAAHKIYESSDGGNSWNNITANGIPNLPVNCVVYQNFSNEELYIGTDVGVYYKNNIMTDWIPYMTGLPNVIVNELEIHYGSGKIRAATFGRGVWESDLQTPPNSINLKNNLNVNVFPTIFNEYLHFVVPKTSFLNITMFDLSGKKVLTFKGYSNNEIINTSFLPSGYYIAEIKTGDFYPLRKKLVKY